MEPTELLGNYLVALNTHPLRTKSITSGVLNGLSELLASILSGQRDPRSGTIITARVPQMAAYGAIVAGPLSHYLVDIVQRAFRGRRGAKWNIAQIIALNIFVNPILNLTFLVSMSIIAGARTWREVKARIKVAYWPLVRSTWISSPLVIALAQRFVPKLAWTPMFSLFAFVLSVYHNVTVKRRTAKKDQ